MANRKRSVRVPLDYGNTPDNPLSSYRMSMLSHGFLPSEDSGQREYVPDESSPISYAVVGLRKRGSVALMAVGVVLVCLILVVLLLS